MSPELWCVIGADHLAVELNAAGEPHLHLQPADAAPSAVMVRVLQRVSSPSQCVVVMPAECAEIGHQLVATHVPFAAMLMLADDDSVLPEGFVRLAADADTAALRRALGASAASPATPNEPQRPAETETRAQASEPQASSETQPDTAAGYADVPDEPAEQLEYDPRDYDSEEYSEPAPPAASMPPSPPENSVITMPPPNLDADPLTGLLHDSEQPEIPPHEGTTDADTAVPDAAAVARAMTGSEVVPDPLFESGQFDDDEDDDEIANDPADQPSQSSTQQATQPSHTSRTTPAPTADSGPGQTSEVPPTSSPEADEDPLAELLNAEQEPAAPPMPQTLAAPPFPKSPSRSAPYAEEPPPAARPSAPAAPHSSDPQQRPDIHHDVPSTTPRIPPASAPAEVPPAAPSQDQSTSALPQATPRGPTEQTQVAPEVATTDQPATASPAAAAPSAAAPTDQRKPPAELLDMTPADEWRPPAQGYSGPVGRCVAVLASKGGIGKTTLTLWVAEAMKTKHERVCVVDANLDNSDIAYLAGAYRKSAGLAGLIGPKPPTEAQIEEALLQVDGLGHLLSGPQFRTTQSQAAAARTLGYVIGYLRTRFEWVFVDLPVAGADTTMLTDFALRSGMIDLYMAVFTTENPDIRSVSSWFKEQQLPPERGGSSLDLRKCVAIINKSDGTQVDPAGLQGQITKKLKMTVAGHVPLVPTLGARRNDQVWRCPPEAQQGIAEFCYNAFKVNFGAAAGKGESSDEKRWLPWRRNRRARTVT